MKPYWSQEFTFDNEKHLVSLYQYPAKCNVLESTLFFGKSFSKYFKELGGKYNSKLKFSEEEKPKGGWIFRSSEESQGKLNDLLRRIYKGDIEPVLSKVIAPSFDNKDLSIKIFNKLQNILELLPDEEFSSDICENSEFKNVLYANLEDEEEAEGDTIYSVVSSRNKFIVNQVKK